MNCSVKQKSNVKSITQVPQFITEFQNKKLTIAHRIEIRTQLLRHFKMSNDVMIIKLNNNDTISANTISTKQILTTQLIKCNNKEENNRNTFSRYIYDHLARHTQRYEPLITFQSDRVQTIYLDPIYEIMKTPSMTSAD